MERTKAQHYLLSARARTLSLIEIARLSDDEALDLFKQSRWGETDRNPVCLCCNHDGNYSIKTRKQWRCKSCKHTFSVTSGTIFANQKMPLQN